MAFFHYNLGKLASERQNYSGFNETRWWGSNGISWSICKSFTPCSRQLIMPVPYHSGQMPFLPLNQQRQSTEGTNTHTSILRPSGLCRDYPGKHKINTIN